MCAASGPLFNPSSFFLLQSLSAAHSGYTNVENTIRFPSGTQSRLSTSIANDVSWVASPPSAGIIHACDPSLRVEVNRIDFPSGDHFGAVSEAGSLVIL